MAKITLEIENDLITFFRKHIDDTEPVEVLLVKMLKLLRELLLVANEKKRLLTVNDFLTQ